MMIDVAILAGGSGTRLWPMSNKKTQKQFLKLPYDETLLEQAYARARLLTSQDHIWVVTLENQVAQTRSVLPNLSKDHIFAEPMGRNSGPAAAAITFYLQAKRKKPTTLLVMAADHYIPDGERFRLCVEKGTGRASEGESLITFGLPIQEPRIEFGYVEVGKKAIRKDVFPAKRFIEKPSLNVAKRFARSKSFYWNSGIFAWRTDLFLKELSRWAKNIYGPMAGMDWSLPDLDSVLPDVYNELPNISIDYAVMEKSSSVDVVRSKFAWSDLGTWASVYEAIASKKNDNVLLGNGSIKDSKGNLVISKSRNVTLFGVSDLVVVQTDDDTLVTTREMSRRLKQLLERR